ncbi:MAG: phenylacetic acid degradation operon negative regulatory protein PaaX [Woeseiaceae bacterium]
MTLESTTKALLAEFQARPTVRAGSLIVTVFGDAIAARGGAVWIGSLIRVLADFGISERLVRTSVYRLSRDGWFEVEQTGRRSYYSLSMEGARKFELATHRIYGEPRQAWSGEWCLLLLAELDARRRESVRRELAFLGFAALSSGLLAHPAPDMTELGPTLKALDPDEEMLLMHARTAQAGRDRALLALVRKNWSLDALDQRYAAFVQRFRPVLAAAARKRRIDPRCGFQIRMLLIQEYRRILLRDPLLPSELLPSKWHGTAAYQLCRNLYRSVFAAADHYLSKVMETADGPLPPPAPGFYTRFGGLRNGERRT